MNYTTKRACRRCGKVGHYRSTCKEHQKRVEEMRVGLDKLKKEFVEPVLYAKPHEPAFKNVDGLVRGVVVTLQGWAFEEEQWDIAVEQLIDAKWHVIHAHGVAELLKYVEQVMPDAVFLDAFPGLNSKLEHTEEIVGRISAACPITAIVVVAGALDEKECKRVKDAGADFCGYLTSGRPAPWRAEQTRAAACTDWSPAVARRLGVEVH